MKFILLLGSMILFCLGSSAVAAETFMLPSTIPPHPRLLASPADWTRLQSQIHTDPVSACMVGSMEEHAKKLLTEPPAERKLTGRRLLGVSREVLRRIITLAMVARVTGDKAYAERAIAEMKAVADFTDWNPSHFLDVGEMSLAVAIGYDWLFDSLNEADRQKIGQALLEKGIQPSFAPNQWWVTGSNNWNQVCHCGVSAAAIAIANLQPELATRILQRAIDNVPRAAASYAPDGAYAEGPMYWNYGTSYHVILAAALQQFGGKMYGLDTAPGFMESAVYMAQMTAPSGLLFDYSDCREKSEINIPLFWMARQARHSEWLELDLKHFVGKKISKSAADDRLLALALLWRAPSMDGKQGTPPLHWMARGANPVSVHRSAFRDPSALYLGIKGGSPSNSHAHMDAGSFVIEADGIRWAVDLGMQDYESLESKGVKLWNGTQNSERWSVFRVGPEGHNILRFNDAPLLVKGHAAFVRFRGEGDRPHSVLELTSLYGDSITAAYRGAMVVENRALLLQDEWTAGAQPVEAAWQMLTRAQIVVHAGEIQLQQDGKTLTLKILEPANAQIEIKSAQELQKPIDVDNPGVQRITLKTRTIAHACGRLRIFVLPASAAGIAAPETQSVLDWSSAL